MEKGKGVERATFLEQTELRRLIDSEQTEGERFCIVEVCESRPGEDGKKGRKKEAEKQKRDKTQGQQHKNIVKEYKKKDKNEGNKNIKIDTETKKF